MNRFSKSILTHAVFLALYAVPVTSDANISGELHFTGYTLEVNPMFRFKIMNNGDYVQYTPNDYEYADVDFNKNFEISLKNAADYWYEILGSNYKSSYPMTYLIKPFYDPLFGAAAGPGYIKFPNGRIDRVGPYVAIMNDYHDIPGINKDELLGFIEIGQKYLDANGNERRDFSRIKNLNRGSSDENLSVTFVHEIIHSLGFVMSLNISDNGSLVFSNNRFRLYDHIYDNFGTKANAGMEIVAGTEKVDGKFVVYANDENLTKVYGTHGGAYFSGDNILDVLNGAKLNYPTTCYGYINRVYSDINYYLNLLEQLGYEPTIENYIEYFGVIYS